MLFPIDTLKPHACRCALRHGLFCQPCDCGPKPMKRNRNSGCVANRIPLDTQRDGKYPMRGWRGTSAKRIGARSRTCRGMPALPPWSLTHWTLTRNASHGQQFLPLDLRQGPPPNALVLDHHVEAGVAYRHSGDESRRQPRLKLRPLAPIVPGGPSYRFPGLPTRKS